MGLGLVGCLYTVGAALAVRHFPRRHPVRAGQPLGLDTRQEALRPPAHEGAGHASHQGSWPGVTILKPLHRDEPRLRENLLSFCDQDYPGPVQVIFGVQSPHDEAIPVVRAVMAARPDCDLHLVVDARLHGSNRKVSNLINMAALMRHDCLVLADSDMAVGPDYLAGVIRTLDRPGIGAVTCAYHGAAARGLWSRLSALGIDTHFLPGVLVGTRLGLAQPCMGSTIALHRDTLERVGGLAAVADRLADDHALGEAVRRLGLRVALCSFSIAHTCTETSFTDLMRHELRWARTVAAIDRAGYAGSGVTHAVPFALAGAVFAEGSEVSLACLALALASRSCLLLAVTRRFGLARSPLWLLPLRDLLSFWVYVMSYLRSEIHWRGHTSTLRPDGSLAPLAVPLATPLVAPLGPSLGEGLMGEKA